MTFHNMIGLADSMDELIDITACDGFYSDTFLKAPYRGLGIIRYGFDEKVFVNLYTLREGNSSCLIYLPGSGYDSILGSCESDTVKFSFFSLICQTLRNSLDIAALEKFSIQPFEKCSDYNIMKEYSLEKIVNYNSQILEDYFKEHSHYKSIYLMGVSEGGSLAPLIYERLKESFPIEGLIMLSSGCLSHKEELLILKKSYPDLPSYYKKEIHRCEQFFQELEKDKYSLKKSYLGEPYFRWGHFLDYSSLPYLMRIDLSILLIHGVKDINVPVESARTLQSNYRRADKKYLTYLEVEGMGHRPEDEGHINMIFSAINRFTGKDSTLQ